MFFNTNVSAPALSINLRLINLANQESRRVGIGDGGAQRDQLDTRYQLYERGLKMNGRGRGRRTDGGIALSPPPTNGDVRVADCGDWMTHRSEGLAEGIYGAILN